MKIKLSKAIDVDGSPTKELSLREPEFRDIVAMGRGQSDAEQTMLLLAAVAEITPREVGTMRPKDVAKCMEAIQGFLDTSEADEKQSNS